MTSMVKEVVFHLLILLLKWVCLTLVVVVILGI